MPHISEGRIGTPVQLLVHQWNEDSKSWTDQAVAFTQGTVTPRHMVNGTLFLLAGKQPSGAVKHDSKNTTLPRGRYQVRVYVDSEGLLVTDRTLMLGEQQFVGQAEIKSAHWREGFRQAESITGAALK